MKYIKSLNISIILMLLIMAPIFADNTQSHADESWKNRWYVNAIWYQIFPDRFFNTNHKNDPLFSANYDKKGKLIPLRLSDWERDRPTNTCKYGGDLEGIEEKLPWLTSLGVTALWMNPVFSATSNHRYNTSDYRTIDQDLGNTESLCRLVENAHKDGIRIILDGVFNHTGYEFWAFQDVVRNGKKSPYYKWYYIKSSPVVPLWEQNRKRPANYECWWGVPSLPKLNYDSAAVRKHIYEITEKWMKCGIDGWRLDVPEEIKNDQFWSEWCALVKKLKSDAYISGEIWGDGSSWLNNGDRFDGLMNYHGFRDPVLRYFSGRTIKVSEFDRILSERRALSPHRVNCAMQNLLSSHDTARILSAMQNRDKADNDKEKKNYDCGPASAETLKRLKAVVLFQMTYVGAPMIYYGDEIGMTGGKDPDCRRPMMWNPEHQDRHILEWYRKLISIRKSHSALRTGDFTTVMTDDGKDLYLFRRSDDKESMLIAINNAAKTATVSIRKNDADALSIKDLITNSEFFSSSGTDFEISIPPFSGRILKERTHPDNSDTEVRK
ncbi:MAG: glycoside hydrolase family 13 protein [Candidatus Xenobiia bacterium LiM19]